MKRNLLIFCIAIFLIMATSWLLDGMTGEQSPRKGIDAYPEIIKPDTAILAPDFTFQPLHAKSSLSLSQLRGKTVLLNFWASWCAPCVIEFPKLAQLAADYPDTLIVLAISADSEEKDIKKFLSRFTTTIPPGLIVIHDKNKNISQDLFQTIRLPETIIIDPSGNMVRKVIGDTDWTGQDMRAYLEALARP